MYTVAIVLCALVAVVSAQAERDARVPQFLEGVSVGMTLDMGNITECTSDLRLSVQHFDESLSTIARGLKSGDRAVVAAGLASMGKGMQEIAHAFTVCGLFSVAEQTERLGELISGESPFAVSNDLDISVGSSSLTEDVKNAAKYWDSKDTFQAGVYQGRILSALLSRAAPTQQNNFRRQATYMA